MHECPDCGVKCSCDCDDLHVEHYAKCQHFRRAECAGEWEDDDEYPPDCTACGCSPCDCEDGNTREPEPGPWS